jgi:uncharacterized sulfatase
MKKTNYLPLFLSGAPLIALSAEVQPQETKPNIVVFVADDLGTNELGCYGGTNVQTPNIDRLAKEGILLTNNYASCAMSVPIRASLYTGLYPARHGSYQNHKATYSNIKSVTHYFSNLGYRVGRTGKDHPSGQPSVYAFEVIPGFTVDCTASKPSPATTEGIEQFMQRNDDEPFCLYICSINSHMPWDAGDASKFNPNTITLPPNCVDNERTRNEFCNYLAEIKVLDDEVGAVMNTLEKIGKLDNTMVIFLGEQGPQMPFGKWTCYRYGQHSAFIARYPSKIVQNTVSDALVQYEDILPTMIEFAGGDPIEGIDGRSFLDVLFGEKKDHREWAYGIHNNIPEGTSYPIRSIQDKRYKLIMNLTPDSDYYEKHMMASGDNMWNSWLQTAQTNEYAKFLTERFMKRPAIEFYDLVEDPWELNNIAALPEYEEIIETMKAELKRWMEQQGDRGVLMDTDDPEDPNLKEAVAISSLEDIDNFMRYDLTGNYYLTNDIEIPEGTEWVPIGAVNSTDSDPQRFKGIFDGRGHSIKNLKITTEGSFKGLFGRIDHAEIKDIDLVNVDIKGKSPVGGISGSMIGSSKIERVSVSGNIEGDTEVGGIVGRVARDPTHTDYNTIYDCYVSANIKAKSLSTDMNNPSCAGGIAAFSHSPSGTSVSKIDIRRVYVTGSVISEQKNNVAGNAAGILAFYDNHNYVKMQEVIVLCDTIGAATSNLFFCRRGPSYADFELFDKVYARDDIKLYYFNPSDKGRGGEIPEGIINYFPVEVYKTKQFYETNLSWDFNNTWDIKEGEFPTLKRNQISNSLPSKGERPLKYKLISNKEGIDIQFSCVFSMSIYDLTGKKVFDLMSTTNHVFIPLKRGIYLIKLTENGNQYSDKVIVF